MNDTPRFDVLVAGAGASGMAAAIAAARQGARVALIEQSATPGGANTQALVGPLMGFHSGKTQVIGGIAQELVDRLILRGGSLGHIPDPLGVASSITPIEPENLRQLYFEMLAECPGITLFLQTLLCGASVENGQIQSVQTASKAGLSALSAKCYIDASGDADLAQFAGVPCQVGRARDGLSQPMTLVIKLGGVDFGRVKAAMRHRPDQFVLAKDALKQDYVAVSGYFDEVRRAREAGEITFPRDRVLLFQGVRPDEAVVNMSRVIEKSALSPAQMTQAQAEGQAQAQQILSFLRRRIDGFQNAFLIQTGQTIGVRESRHILGDYTLTQKDVQHGACFDDAVCMCAFPIDIHDPRGASLACDASSRPCLYDLPYRVMLPLGLKNLLVTGRAISAEHEAAASARITPTAMALGEAAGIAAALSQGDTRSVDVSQLQQLIAAAHGLPGQRSLRECK
ncbi:MAG: FAD-dependent oxidoreductase [Clostridia bacterium]|nr:FAD-dependent oxidoreductase [Clostridia bacterium]